MPRSCFLLFMSGIVFLMSGCTYSDPSATGQLLKKDKVKVTFTSFFVEKGNRDIENLSLNIEMTPSKQLNQPVTKKGCAVIYDKEGEKKTIESLNAYIKGLKDYNRYILGFNIDSTYCKVIASGKFDILQVMVLDKKSATYHTLSESYFIQGTILKVVEKEFKANHGDFEGIAPEKTRVSLFDENKLFYQSEQKLNGEERSLKYNEDDAYRQMQDAFLFRQFCRDALLKLKELHPDWFEEMM